MLKVKQKHNALSSGAQITKIMFCALITLIVSTASGSDNIKSKPLWEFDITNVKKVEVDRNLQLSFPVIAQWIVTTKISNNSQDARYFSTIPTYGGTVRSQMERFSFLNGSHVPIKSKENDFILLQPGHSLIAQHFVFACPSKEKNKYIIYGFFSKTLNVDKEKQANNSPHEWCLSETPIENFFQLSITLFDWTLSGTKEILGLDYDNRWQGEMMTKPVELKVLGTEK